MAAERIRPFIARLAPALGLSLAGIGAWEALVHILGVPSYKLPAPSAIAVECFESITLILDAAAVTAVEAVLGFAVANVLAFGASVLFVRYRTLGQAAYPFAIALKTTPVIALAPLLVVWLGSGVLSKAAAAALVCFFPTLVNSIRGLSTVGKAELYLFRTLHASEWQIMRHLRIPFSLPYVLSALKVSSSLAVVGAIVGEFVGSNRGLGFLILSASYKSKTPRMFAAILAAALLGMVLFFLVSLWERTMSYGSWREGIDGDA